MSNKIRYRTMYAEVPLRHYSLTYFHQEISFVMAVSPKISITLHNFSC